MEFLLDGKTQNYLCPAPVSFLHENEMRCKKADRHDSKNKFDADRHDTGNF